MRGSRRESRRTETIYQFLTKPTGSSLKRNTKESENPGTDNFEMAEKMEKYKSLCSFILTTKLFRKLPFANIFFWYRVSLEK